jgi:competence protein ComEA
MQRLEKEIILVVFLGIIACLTISYLLKTGCQIVSPVIAEVEGLDMAEEKISQSKIININTANRYHLAKLPGIGPKLAECIIESRETHGPFNSPEEIMRVKGIGQKKYQVIAEMIVIND